MFEKYKKLDKKIIPFKVLYCDIETKLIFAIGDLRPSKDFTYEIFYPTC